MLIDRNIFLSTRVVVTKPYLLYQELLEIWQELLRENPEDDIAVLVTLHDQSSYLI